MLPSGEVSGREHEKKESQRKTRYRTSKALCDPLALWCEHQSLSQETWVPDHGSVILLGCKES